jgi:epoxyqueuosine reductase
MIVDCEWWVVDVDGCHPHRCCKIDTMHDLTQLLKRTARQLGFDHCRITPVSEPPHMDFFDLWLAQGRAGVMHYLERNVEKRRDPRLLVKWPAPSPRSLIVLAVNHHQFDLPPAIRDDSSRGIIASYAWCDDYHTIIRPLLYELDALIRQQSGRTTLGKALVDSGPVLERDWALQSGLGFTGKNCCTIHPTDGSWLLLATLLVPEVLDYDPPPQAAQPPNITAPTVAAGLLPAQSYGAWQITLDEPPLDSALSTPHSTLATCGRCTRCLDACPTNAFVGPFYLDPLRCISYWTIETQSPIPPELRRHFGNRIFGCDICQEVCPYNQRLPERTPLMRGLAAQHERVAPPLLEGFDTQNPYWLDEAAFAHRFRNSPILRAKRRGMLRNVCVALGNWGDPATTPALRLALYDGEPLVRGHAAWALGEVLRRREDVDVRAALVERTLTEPDSWVRAEIDQALKLTG